MRLGFAYLLLLGSTARAATVAIGPYLQDARTDGVTVVWETDAPSEGAVFVEDGAGERSFPSPRGTHHAVRLDGLAPGRHRYRVTVDGQPAAGPFELATAPAGDRFTFLVYGDERDGAAEHARVVARMRDEHADLLINTGDLVGDAAEEPLWRRFFTVERALLAEAPFYPALGNHEVLHDPPAAHFHRFFALADHYRFRFGNSLFVALDGNRSRDRAQAAWLLQTLDEAAADPAVRHVFVFFHQPPFSVGDFCGSAAEQGLWVPEFAARGVRAVFTGHDHSYQRLVRDGVRYFVTGGGGAPLHKQTAHCPEHDRHALRKFVSAYHYLRVRVDGDRADLVAIGVDGEVLDEVALHEAPAPAPTPAPPIPWKDAPLRAPVVATRARLGGGSIALLVGLAAAAAVLLGLRRRR